MIKRRDYIGTAIQLLCPIVFFFLFLISELVGGKPTALEATPSPEITQIRPLQLIELAGQYPPTGPYFYGKNPFPVDMDNFYLLYAPNDNQVVNQIFDNFSTNFLVSQHICILVG